METKQLWQSVRDYYAAHNNELSEMQRWHINTRLWLGTSDILARQWLDSYQCAYLGKNSMEHRARLTAVMANELLPIKLPPCPKYQSVRAEAFARYPRLITFERILVHTLFSATIYETDIRAQTRTLPEMVEMRDYAMRLWQDLESAAKLSSYAINFLYLYDDLLSDRSRLDVLPAWTAGLAANYYGSSEADWHLKIYLITHAVINASRFYARLVSDSTGIYAVLLKEAENIIRDHYHDLSLDVKFEFLVTCRLAQVETSLKNDIFEEAAQSVSNHGTFLVDSVNRVKEKVPDELGRAEHSNSLFLMAYAPAGKMPIIKDVLLYFYGESERTRP